MNTCAATALDDAQNQAALVRAGGDVEEAQLVGTLLVIATRDLDRVAGIAQADEIDALDDAAAGHVETRNDALCETHGNGRSRDGG